MGLPKCWCGKSAVWHVGMGHEFSQEPTEPAGPVSVDPSTVQGKAQAKLEESERKAWVSLAGYKFIMFGYWAGQWVLCKSLLPGHFPNPFYELARLARQECLRRGWLGKGDEP